MPLRSPTSPLSPPPGPPPGRPRPRRNSAMAQARAGYKEALTREVAGQRKSRAELDRMYARRHGLRFFYMVGTCIALVALAQASIAFLADMPYFRIKEVRVQGVSAPVRQEIEGLASTFLVGLNHNLLSMNTRQLQRRMRDHPRIARLKLEKVYPDTLVINAVEREPVAVVSAEGFYLVDKDGVAIQQLAGDELAKIDLPYVTGVGSDEIQLGQRVLNPRLYKALEMLRLLKERNAELYRHFSEVNVGVDPQSQMDALTAHMRGGMELRFGDRDPIELLPAFDLYTQMMQKEKLDPMGMAYVDLRFKNQIVYMDRQTALATAAGLGENLRQAEVDAMRAATTAAEAAAKKKPGSPGADAAKKPGGDRPSAGSSGGGTAVSKGKSALGDSVYGH